ncbi:MAG: ribbon-helix-helix domain-containing protein [Azoarcus sp.]|jgi:hypothetical protein|nr:ribbon-helix-helix domain-containing protein [Azoarcus sp.]
MAITKPKAPVQPSVEAFITAAPDATAVRGVRVGRKRQITFALDPNLLAELDSFAREIGLSRATVISLSIQQALNNGLNVTGLNVTTRSP